MVAQRPPANNEPAPGIESPPPVPSPAPEEPAPVPAPPPAPEPAPAPVLAPVPAEVTVTAEITSTTRVATTTKKPKSTKTVTEETTTSTSTTTKKSAAYADIVKSKQPKVDMTTSSTPTPLATGKPLPTGSNLTLQETTVHKNNSLRAETIAPSVVASVIALFLIFFCYRRRQKKKALEEDDLERQKTKDVSFFDSASEKSIRTKAAGLGNQGKEMMKSFVTRKDSKQGRDEKDDDDSLRGIKYEETGRGAMTPQSTAETLVNAPESIKARRLTSNINEWIYGVKGRASVIKSKIGSMRRPQSVMPERQTESAASQNTVTVGNVEGFQFGFDNDDVPGTPMTSAPAPREPEPAAQPDKKLSSIVSRVQSMRRTVSLRTRSLIPARSDAPELPVTEPVPAQPTQEVEPHFSYNGFPLTSPTDTFDYEYSEALAFEHYFSGRPSWAPQCTTSNNRVSLWGGSSVGSISIQDSLASPGGATESGWGMTESGWSNERSSYYAENVAYEPADAGKFKRCASFNALEYLRQVEEGRIA